jgi:hypothetical protein
MLAGVAERPRELEQQCAEPAALDERRNAVFEILLVVRRGLAFVSEGVEELGGELKLGVGRDALHPFLGRGGPGRAVVGRVDFDGGEVAGKIGEFVEAAGLRLGIHHAVPIFVFPARRADANHV